MSEAIAAIASALLGSTPTNAKPHSSTLGFFEPPTPATVGSSHASKTSVDNGSGTVMYDGRIVVPVRADDGATASAAKRRVVSILAKRESTPSDRSYEFPKK